MKKIFLLFAIAIAFNAKSQTNTFPTTGSAGIGTLAPNATALLDITSTTKGVLMPRMTKAQRDLIATPATGLMIFQTNQTPGFYWYSGTQWVQMSNGKANLSLNNLSAVTAINQSLVPGIHNSIDLGSNSNRWRDLYVGGASYITGNSNVSGNSQFTGTISVGGNTVCNSDLGVAGTSVFGGNLNLTNSAANTIQFANSGPSGMIHMFPNGTANADRMVIQHSSTYPNWGLQYQDATDQFNFLGQGNPVMSVNLYPGSVGIGTATPGAKFDIAGSGSYDLTGGYSDFRLGDATYNLKMGVANAGGGAGDAYVAGSGRLYLGTSNTFTRSQTVAINPDGTVGVGGYIANAKLGVTGDTISSVPVISATATYTGGNSDVRGVQSTSVIAPGYGFGVHATGGYMGGYFNANATTYTGNAYGAYGIANGSVGIRYGVFGNANGTGTGSRYGVYGTASGGDNAWGGYFPAKTYTSELRVGGTQGATGYVAAINGKLIATEVRVDLQAIWPDYVFNTDYNLTPLDELEAKLNADKHLPGVPSASEMKQSGIMLGEMQTKTMEKVEENTLYILQLNNKIKELEKKIEALSKMIK